MPKILTPNCPAHLSSTRKLMSLSSNLLMNSLVPPATCHLQNSCRFSSEANSNEDLKNRFDKLVKNNKIVVFMKGVPDEPRCGFSNAVVQILRMHGVTNYDSHDVLQDEGIRQGLQRIDYIDNSPATQNIYLIK